MKVERDIHVKASLQAAVDAITRRDSEDPPEYRAATTTVEPKHRYGHNEIVEDEVTALQIELHKLRELGGYPTMRKTRDIFVDQNDDPLPIADEIVEPMRGYFDHPSSFGLRIPAGSDSPFAASVHVGDDFAFGQDQATVVAVADGIVRRTVVAQPSWGGLVVIEHQLPDGSRFCSLYGHLGPMITVRPGDTVKAGTKIGSLGRSWTRENGGYKSHIHMGIHLGAVDDAKWITGYVDSDRFDRGEHQWVDALIFLQDTQRRLSRSTE